MDEDRETSGGATTCPDCMGTGSREGEDCITCGGTGVAPEDAAGGGTGVAPEGAAGGG
jgi:DnaJ-class molecular chaperone